MGYVNKWLTPYQRSFSAIKEKLIDGLAQLKDPKDPTKPLITDFTEGNILVIILSLFSAIAEIIHYYIDNMARESFFSSCRRYDSLLKHANFVDYYPHGATAAKVDVVLIASKVVTGQVLISKDMEFTDRNGNKWLPDIKENLNWDLSKSQLLNLSLIQHTQMSLTNIGTIPTNTDDQPVRIVISSLSNGYIEHDSINRINVGGTQYTLVDTFAYSKPDDKHFRCYLDSTSGNTIIQFGDGQYGYTPGAGETVGDISCYTTKGTEGNIEADGIPFVPNQVGIDNVVITCTNPYRASGGSNGEDFSAIKRHVPQSVRTMGVAITKQDFQDLAELQPDVDQAVIEYECGRKLNIFIKPINGVVASTALCERVYQEVIQHCPITTWLSVSPVGEIPLHISMEVTGRKGYKADDILTSIKSALTSKAYLMHIGDSIRISDIYALIDNLPMVDYLHISEFYAVPQTHIIYGNAPLVVNGFRLSAIKGQKKMLVQFIDANTFMMCSYYNTGTRTEAVRGTLNSLTSYKDNEVDFNISFASGYTYDSRYRYIFTIAEPNMDMVNTGHNVPIIDVNSNDVNIVINEVI